MPEEKKSKVALDVSPAKGGDGGQNSSRAKQMSKRGTKSSNTTSPTPRKSTKGGKKEKKEVPATPEPVPLSPEKDTDAASEEKLHLELTKKAMAREALSAIAESDAAKVRAEAAEAQLADLKTLLNERTELAMREAEGRAAAEARAAAAEASLSGSAPVSAEERATAAESEGEVAVAAATKSASEVEAEARAVAAEEALAASTHKAELMAAEITTLRTQLAESAREVEVAKLMGSVSENVVIKALERQVEKLEKLAAQGAAAADVTPMPEVAAVASMEEVVEVTPQEQSAAILEGLRAALRANHSRVLDLFRSWDKDSSGTVCAPRVAVSAVSAPIALATRLFLACIAHTSCPAPTLISVLISLHA